MNQYALPITAVATALVLTLAGCVASETSDDPCWNADPTTGECPEGCFPVVGGYLDEEAGCTPKSRTIACTGCAWAVPAVAAPAVLVRLCEDQREYAVAGYAVADAPCNNPGWFCPRLLPARNAMCLAEEGGVTPTTGSLRELTESP